MRAEEKNMVERIMDTETMGYAYEYPYGGGARKEYMLALTPENLANFINFKGISQITIRKEVKTVIFMHLKYMAIGSIMAEVVATKRFCRY